MSITVAIVDYGMGNLHSVYRKLYNMNVVPVVTSDADKILEADKIILPGVGHFGKAMQHLKDQGLYDSLNEAVLIKKKPILGICLGMQLMANKSEEGEASGFGWINAKVVKFKIKDTVHYKVPQTGWNTVSICKSSSLLRHIENGDEFYFLHSFHYSDTSEEDKLTVTNFEYEYVSAVEKENIFGTQFHPEKSHDQGIRIFKNFIEI
ncbi:MAG: imidazole glycerol phosphate synthase subunit HisH [Chitinophagales bacterium]|nr:imidazole glycerol phosphate synthase subunit HisH [Chitinophagales bacterium]